MKAWLEKQNPGERRPSALAGFIAMFGKAIMSETSKLRESFFPSLTVENLERER